MCQAGLPSVTVCAMTYGYGEDIPPRRRGPYRDEPDEVAPDQRLDPSDDPQRGVPNQYGGPTQYGMPAQHGSQYGSPAQHGGPQAPGHQPSSYPQQPTYPQQPEAPADPFAQGPYPPRPTRPSGGTYGRAYGSPRSDAPPPPEAYPARDPYGRPDAYSQPTEYRAPTRSFPPPQPPQRVDPTSPGQYGGAQQPAPGQYRDAQYPPGQHGPGQYGNPTRAQGSYDSYGAERYQPASSFGESEPGDEQAAPAKRSRTWLTVAIVLIVLVVAGGGWYYFNRDSGGTAVATNNPPTAEQAKRVADQKVDSASLTEAEVFGSGSVPSSADGGGSYKIVKTQAASDCKTAVGGDIATVLTSAGCSQVVRATMTSPDGTYVITAGIFNLADSAKASDAQAAIKTAINDRKGRFSGLAGGGTTNVIELAAANVAWDIRGHYLTYCVIAMANGSAISGDDSRTPLIISDIVEAYLGGTVIHQRETGAGPTPKSS
jgi:hypothetical protein